MFISFDFRGITLSKNSSDNDIETYLLLDTEFKQLCSLNHEEYCHYICLETIVNEYEKRNLPIIKNMVLYLKYKQYPNETFKSKLWLIKNYIENLYLQDGKVANYLKEAE